MLTHHFAIQHLSHLLIYKNFFFLKTINIKKYKIKTQHHTQTQA